MGQVFTAKELKEIIEKDGWELVNVKGSHYKFRHKIKSGSVTIPFHKKDIKKGTANSVLKQAGLK